MSQQEERKTPPGVHSSQTALTNSLIHNSPGSSASTLLPVPSVTMASTREARLTPQEKELMLDIGFMAREECGGKYLTEAQYRELKKITKNFSASFNSIVTTVLGHPAFEHVAL